MQERAISKFKVNCHAVVEKVRRTGKPIRITRFGKPLAELVAAKPEKRKFALGAMKGKMEIVGDIVGPIGAFEPWEMYERNLV